MTPFERAIWEKANRERREAQDKANRERREAQDRLNVERRRARDKFLADLRRQLDKLRQEMRDAATSERKGQIQAAIDAAKREIEQAENPAAALIAAGKAASAEKVDNRRGDARGLVVCDVGGLAKRSAELLAFFDAGVAGTAGLESPQMPPFLGEGGMWGTPGWYVADSAHELWLGPFDSGSVSVEGTYFQQISDSAFDATWGAWLSTIAPIDNILGNANELENYFGHLVGSSGFDRAVWRPGRIDWSILREALSSVHPEASIAWNAAFGNIPTPPGSITLTTFDEIEYPAGGGEFFTMRLRRPENHDSSGEGFEVAQELWDTWLDDLDSSYSDLLDAREKLIASRPALQRAVEAFRPFGLGTQYRFRGY